MSEIKLKYLVTGTGRCGTVYMARLLSSLGIMCGHESIFTFDGLSQAKNRLLGKSRITLSGCCIYDIKKKEKIASDWFKPKDIIADSSYLAAPFLKEEILKDTKIIHLVRNPIKVISSQVLDAHFFKFPNQKQLLWQEFVLIHFPELADIKDQIERACYFYVVWNNLIANSKESFFHRVEDGLTDDLCGFLDIKKKQIETLLSCETNSWGIRKRDLSYDEIPSGKIKNAFIEQVYKYGYKVE